VISQDEVEDAAPEPNDNRPVAGGAPNFAWSVAGEDLDAAAAKVADRFGPDARPEAMKLLGRALRAGIHDSMNGHPQPRWCAGGNGRGGCCPDEMPTRHSASRTPSIYFCTVSS